MGRNTRYSGTKKILLVAIMLAIIVATILPVVMFTQSRNIDCVTDSLSSGWDVWARGEHFSDVTLADTQFDIFNQGDELVVSKRLDSDIEVPLPVLKFYSIHSVVTVALDDEIIYCYGQQYFKTGELIGYGWNFVELPVDYKNKILTITFQVTENNAFEGLPTISIVQGDRMVQKSISEGRIGLLISMFLILFGFLGMWMSFILLVSNSASLKMFCITLFSFLIGVYTLCNGDLITLFSTNLYVKVYLEYCTFFLFVIPVTVYFHDWVLQENYPKAVRMIYYIWLLFEIGFAGAVMLLQFFNIVHFPVFVSWEHVVMAGALLLIVLLSTVEYKRTHHLERGMTVGFILALIVAAFELIRYNFDKYISGFTDNKYNSTMGIAALILVIALFVDFSTKITQSIKIATEQELLESLAYSDGLTGLANRRACEDAMSDYASDKKSYALISMDMNYLKRMNDNFGHAAGDRALILFAEKLKKAFPDPCIVGRMGGDEFSVIIPNREEAWINEQIKQLLLDMEKTTTKEKDGIVLSAAYGIAFSHEALTPEEVYAIADKRMYECKRRSKIKREAD